MVTGRKKIVDVFLDVPFNRFEIVDHRRQIAIAVAQILQQVADREGRGVAGQRPQRIAVLALPQRHLTHQRFELALNAFDLALGLLALIGRQCFEVLRAHHPPVALGRQSEAHRGAHQRDALAFGMLLQRAEGLLAAFLELLLDDLLASVVVVALEGRRKSGAQLVDQPLHRCFERGAAPARQ